MERLWNAIKENWLVATVASVALAVGGIVAFLSGLAAIWTVMSRDTVPEFLEKRGWLSGWSVTTPVFVPLIQVLASMGVLLVLVGLWREAKRQRRPPYPTVQIFRHAQANAETFDKIHQLFAKAGYRIVGGNTNLPEHADGLRLNGGTSTDRMQAIWGLGTISVSPKPYEGTDDTERFQVIVGAYEIPKRLPATSVSGAIGSGLSSIVEEFRRDDEVVQAFNDARHQQRIATATALGRTSVPNEIQDADGLGELSFVKDQRLVDDVVIGWRKTDSNFFVSATNRSGEVIEGFELWVEEPRRFADSKWVRQRDFQDYVPIRLQGTNRLFHDQPEDFRFLAYTTDRLYYSGPSETSPDVQGNFRTLGIWEVTFRSQVGGMTRNHPLYFKWDNLKKTIPTPCDSVGNALG